MYEYVQSIFQCIFLEFVMIWKYFPVFRRRADQARVVAEVAGKRLSKQVRNCEEIAFPRFPVLVSGREMRNDSQGRLVKLGNQSRVVPFPLTGLVFIARARRQGGVHIMWKV